MRMLLVSPIASDLSINTQISMVKLLRKTKIPIVNLSVSGVVTGGGRGGRPPPQLCSRSSQKSKSV